MSQVRIAKRRALNKKRKVIDREDDAILRAVVAYEGYVNHLEGRIAISTKSFLRFMKAAFAEAAKDQERLDWMQKHCSSTAHEAAPNRTTWFFPGSSQFSIRQWIDEQSVKWPDKETK